jgi:hypothetical protein
MKKKPTKKQQVPNSEPATRPAPSVATADTTTLAQLTALVADPTVSCPPWPNKRIAVACPLCGETHANPISYVGRLARRGTATPDELRWLTQHLEAAGIAVPA